MLTPFLFMNLPDHKTIINRTVIHAAAIMQDKMEFNQLVIDQMKDNPERQDTVKILTENNRKIDEAVKLMLENDGCWA